MSGSSRINALRNWARELEINIRNGNVEEAVHLAECLADERVECQIIIQDDLDGQEDWDLYSGGWVCEVCTFINIPDRPGCEMCSAPQPGQEETAECASGKNQESDTYWTETERKKERTEQEQSTDSTREIENGEIFNELLRLEQQPIIWNTDALECPICLQLIEGGEGIKLRECHHEFCQECVREYISISENAYIVCPYKDESYNCESILLDREVKALVTTDIYEKYQQRSMMAVESADPNTFHCRTVNCKGWCFFADDANEFMCPVCTMINCLTCRAIHEDRPCNAYQAWLEHEAKVDEEARKTQETLERMVEEGEALRCPFCAIIIQKKGGCDWVQCSVCRKEICWITKGPRWGKEGRGDISGGCKCRVNGDPCHPQCKNCH